MLRKLVLEMTITLVIVSAVIVFELLVLHFGANSRDAADWHNPRPL